MKRMKVLLMILLAVLVLAGLGFAYLYFNGMSGISQVSQPREGQIRVACIGDSITYGHGISNWPENNYPAVLQDLLGDGYHVQSFGVSGRAVQDTADQPYRAVQQYQDSLAYGADIIVFMMGTNDTKPENWVSEEAFKTALEDLLDDYTVGEKKPALYVCITPASFFTDADASELTNFDIRPAYADTVAGIVRETAQEQGYAVIDIHSLTKANPQWFEKDGVHPSNEGAAAIAKAVFETISQ